MLFLMLFPLAALGLAGLMTGAPVPAPPILLVVVISLLSSVLFGWLTVCVDEQRVLLYFGVGLMRRSFQLGEIRGVRVVRNPAWMGLGIHRIRGGWIYNVSGKDGIELRLADGGVARIGSDDAPALAAAIAAAAGLVVDTTPPQSVR
jgi:hypothetical protein